MSIEFPWELDHPVNNIFFGMTQKFLCGYYPDTKLYAAQECKECPGPLQNIVAGGLIAYALTCFASYSGVARKIFLLRFKSQGRHSVLSL